MGAWLPEADRLRFEEMVELLENDYAANRRRSRDRKASAITTDRIVRYTRARQAEGAASAAVNRELAALKRMFSLAIQARKIPLKPHIPILREDNARKGFFEEPDFRRLLTHLPDPIRPVAEVACLTGWRIADELLTRTGASKPPKKRSRAVGSLLSRCCRISPSSISTAICVA
jgi:hypothetical protein